MSATDTRPSIRYTADLVVFSGNDVLLIERGTEPYAGRWALPGGHVEHNETSRAAAVREAAEETGLTIASSRLLRVGVYDDPDRDPRARVVSVAYMTAIDTLAPVKAGDDARAAAWVDIDDALNGPMAFDHRRILGDAYSQLLDGLHDLI